MSRSLFMLILVLSAAGLQASADYIFGNGRIYVVDDQFSVVDRIAIRGGRIIAVGDAVTEHCDSDTCIVDLEGKTVLPGLIDAHAHLYEYALSLDQVDLRGATTAAELIERISAKAAETPAGVWIIGEGWDQNAWTDHDGFPNAAMLDLAAPEHPVALKRIDYHALWVNSKAMEIADITPATEDLAGGQIIRDNESKPTGVLLDYANDIVEAKIPAPPIERIELLVKKAISDMHAVGLVGHHEMMATPRMVELVKRLIDRGEFPYRMVAYYVSDLANIDQLMEDPLSQYGDSQLFIAGLKAFADGALGSHGAALLEPYSDHQDETGLLLVEPARLAWLTELALTNGKQIATHAIGDKANKLVLDVYEEVLGRGDFGDHRSRVEHAQVISADDIGRFAKLGVLPSMQPTHCTSDYSWAVTRIGPERIKGAYAWRSLRESGVILPLGSDFPIEQINPFHGIHAAVTRQTAARQPPTGYAPEARLTREEALRGFTIWAAYAARMEAEVGSLEVGKLADFIVIDRDIMLIDASEIRDTVVLQTYFAGEPLIR